MLWYARDTWIQYLASPGAQGMTASDGARLSDPEVYPGSSNTARLAYAASFTYNPAGSWYQPNGAASKGQLNYTGTVHFGYASHGIDITFRDPEIVIDGSSSRIVFTVSGGGCSAVAPKRVTVIDLAAGAPAGANPFTYDQLAGTLDRDGSELFSNMYGAGKDWGMVRNLWVTTTGAAL